SLEQPFCVNANFHLPFFIYWIEQYIVKDALTKNKNNHTDQIFYHLLLFRLINCMAMHYLATGGAGFIGSHLVRRLLNGNKDTVVTCIDNFDPFYPRGIKELNISEFKNDSNFSLLNYDLATTTAKQLDEAIREPV